ncbi:MAG: SusD/RagB family nutrient-binding outer membrane lipoprotein [Bacteroidales bacterium]
MKKIIYSIITLTLAVVLVTGCNKLKDFGNTNTNTQATVSPISSALLTNALSGMGGWSNMVTPCQYCQYISQTQYPDISVYFPNLVSPEANYSGALYDLQNIINYNTDPATAPIAALNGANDNQIAIARILKAYIFWNMTDRWGDIPYTGALTGDPNVPYDTQQNIYRGIIKEMTEAVGQFTTGAPIQGDIIYGGNTAQWQKFANSCRMLMALRLSKVYPGTADSAAIYFRAALADPAGSISTNDDNFVVNYPGGNYPNPWWNVYNGRHDYGESDQMTGLLSALSNDNRQSVFGATITGAPTTKGVPYGRTRSSEGAWPGIDAWCSANADYAYVLNPDFRTQTSPGYVMTAAYVLLARAEAADRGWTSETANTAALYQDGITASYTQWGLGAPLAAYFSSANVVLPSPAGTGANLQQIATQQYVAFYPDGWQAWSNWRRTNWPALSPAIDAVNVPPVIPRRYLYGTQDYALSLAGVTAAAARLTGGDKMDSRIWWDK